MTSVFDVLAKEILPQLRRTKLIADVDIEGRTDAEIKEAAASNIDVLSEEEMLYAATLTDDAAAQLKAYQAAATNTTAFAVTTTQVWFMRVPVKFLRLKPCSKRLQV